MKLIKVFSVAFCLSMFFYPLHLFAQTETPQGLSISPFLLERQMNTGETLKETIEVTNNSQASLPVDISVNDFEPSNESGQPVFLKEGESNARYSLSKWIKILNSPKLVLLPGEKTQIELEITPPLDATSGGHYGAVMFSFLGPKVEGSAVQVAQKLGAIILIKLGKADEDGQITAFSAVKKVSKQGPVNFSLKFKNLGNVHIKPRGGITITNLFGSKVGSALVNEAAGNVLPDSEREFKSVWETEKGFGLYKAEARLTYGDSGALATESATFWILPWATILTWALFAFLLSVLAIFGLSRYNRWIIEKAKLLSDNQTQKETGSIKVKKTSGTQNRKRQKTQN